MTNDDVIFLAESLPFVDAKEMDPDFNYAVSHNLRLCENVAKDIQKAISPTDDFKKFEEDMNKLREKYANKDEHGKLIKQTQQTSNGMMVFYDIPDMSNPKSKFNVGSDKLKKEFQKTIDKREEQMEFLKKENAQVKLMMVDKDLLPKGLTRRAMDAVFFMIKTE